MNPTVTLDTTNLTERIETEIAKLDFSHNPPQLYEPISYILSLGGKRIRPVLLLLACDMFGKSIEDAIPQALAIEIFHNFTLVHDDIMDQAPKRRNQLTVHTKWNENTGILSGDVMLVCAYQQLCKSEDKYLAQLLELFNKTAIEVCEGQQFDMNYETETDVSISEYLRMIELKTAVLLGCSLQTGFIIAGGSSEDQHNIYEFGRNIGIAFQLQDDLLDVFGDPNKFGKQIGGDIISNKKTYLFLKASEIGTTEQKTQLNKLFGSVETDNSEKIDIVTGIYNDLSIQHRTETEMASYYNSAISFLDKINVPEDRKLPLRNFANRLMIRDS
ncbi:MAG: polyprenyl synthetase family protein [Flavobacteriales bacterium]|jgi:geranylgeranyl diphosphate synthase, type II|nr:polyprenyl synthetase family protein [Flavobacteriales bacterium]